MYDESIITDRILPYNPQVNMADTRVPQRIQGLPPSAWYVEDFVSEAEEEYLLRKVRWLERGG